MRLIVGLGNPGEKYQYTRHNLGFIVLDKLLEEVEPLANTYWEEERRYRALLQKVKIKGEEVLLLKPTTFMNESGIAVKKTAGFFHIESQYIYVVHDDIDLPFGGIRIRFGGAAAGHKGVESLIAHLGTDRFLRIRLGIGKPIRRDGELEMRDKRGVEAYVLSTFGSGEKGTVRHMVKGAIDNIFLLLEHGIDQYMGKYYQKLKA